MTSNKNFIPFIKADRDKFEAIFRAVSNGVYSGPVDAALKPQLAAVFSLMEAGRSDTDLKSAIAPLVNEPVAVFDALLAWKARVLRPDYLPNGHPYIQFRHKIGITHLFPDKLRAPTWKVAKIFANFSNTEKGETKAIKTKTPRDKDGVKSAKTKYPRNKLLKEIGQYGKRKSTKKAKGNKGRTKNQKANDDTKVPTSTYVEVDDDSDDEDYEDEQEASGSDSDDDKKKKKGKKTPKKAPVDPDETESDSEDETKAAKPQKKKVTFKPKADSSSSSSSSAVEEIKAAEAPAPPPKAPSRSMLVVRRKHAAAESKERVPESVDIKITDPVALKKVRAIIGAFAASLTPVVQAYFEIQIFRLLDANEKASFCGDPIAILRECLKHPLSFSMEQLLFYCVNIEKAAVAKDTAMAMLTSDKSIKEYEDSKDLAWLEVPVFPRMWNHYAKLQEMNLKGMEAALPSMLSFLPHPASSSVASSAAAKSAISEEKPPAQPRASIPEIQGAAAALLAMNGPSAIPQVVAQQHQPPKVSAAVAAPVDKQQDRQQAASVPPVQPQDKPAAAARSPQTEAKVDAAPAKPEAKVDAAPVLPPAEVKSVAPVLPPTDVKKDDDKQSANAPAAPSGVDVIDEKEFQDDMQATAAAMDNGQLKPMTAAELQAISDAVTGGRMPALSAVQLNVNDQLPAPANKPAASATVPSAPAKKADEDALMKDSGILDKFEDAI